MCVTAGWRGRAPWQGSWGSKCADQAATGPMVTAATVDASAVRSDGRYGLSSVVSRASRLQAAVQAATPQFLGSVSATFAWPRPLCCTVVVASSEGPCGSASWPCPCGIASVAGSGKVCTPRRSECVSYGSCWRCSGAACGRKRSWCRYQWPCTVQGLQRVSHCPTRPPA